MMAKATDGTSRSQLKEGILVGKSKLDFIPWNLSATKRTGELKPWLESWMGKELKFLEPNGWFTWGHDQKGGSYDQRCF
jgi:hypothetical protein